MPSKKQTPAQRGAETRKRNREEKAKKSGKAFSKLFLAKE